MVVEGRLSDLSHCGEKRGARAQRFSVIRSSNLHPFPHILQSSDSMHLSASVLLLSFSNMNQLFWEAPLGYKFAPPW